MLTASLIIQRWRRAYDTLQCWHGLMLSPMRLPSSPAHLSLGHLWGLSCVADHVRSWGWRPRSANPPPRLRKVPFLPAQNENNKEPSVAAASGAQRTHQNTSKSRSLPLARSLARSPALTHPSMRDSSSLKYTISEVCGPSFQATEEAHGLVWYLASRSDIENLWRSTRTIVVQVSHYFYCYITWFHIFKMKAVQRAKQAIM